MQTTQYSSLQDFGDFLGRAGVWALLGGVIGLRGSKLGWCAFLGATVDKGLGLGVTEGIVMAVEKQRQEQERQKYLAQLMETLRPINLEPVKATPPIVPSLSLPGVKQELSPLASPPDADKDHQWREVIVPPSVVLILGGRGSGKSALGYRQLELHRYSLTPYVVGLSKQGQKLLPDWIGVVECLEDLPSKSIALVDEAYLWYHSRESLSSASRDMSRILNLSRQKEQTIIFVSQEARQIDRNIVSSANVLIFKELGMLQLEFDRKELSRLVTKAKQALETIEADRRGWSYVYSPDAGFEGLLENSLPTFWNKNLSHIFAAGGETSATKVPKKATREELMLKAKELYASVKSFDKVANMIGRSKGTAYNYIRDYPYSPAD